MEQKKMEIGNSLRGKRVLVTGHTGFTGGWLCTWLNLIGSEVTGLALKPLEDRSLFGSLGLDEEINSIIGNICDPEAVQHAVDSSNPDVIFHLAAQSIVSKGYDDPRETFETNVMGTLNVLEAARNCSSTKAVVCVTTDKVYENKEWVHSYRETDRLGGKDPYSASKVGSEVVIQTYISTLSQRGNGVSIASARGGNIIGGGDWSENRIVPDIIRAFDQQTPLVIRNPLSTRPWQHVLALVHGYIQLAEKLMKDNSYIGGWNFGPGSDGTKTVEDLIGIFTNYLGDIPIEQVEGKFQEANLLQLTSEKANRILDWNPRLNFVESCEWTANWYREYLKHPDSAYEMTHRQINNYLQNRPQT